MTLALATVARLPWWRRLLGALSRRRALAPDPTQSDRLLVEAYSKLAGCRCCFYVPVRRPLDEQQRRCMRAELAYHARCDAAERLRRLPMPPEPDERKG